ncbi:7668_t:CDS:10 [Paraglomus occultum]|uniref:separase n=1 Tax=Paraglomus occultum TaxID=144539 RepID=A0A9N9A5C3_9GLOM|nr:7668_t:CDS:10 [Paraglomus occultum]
MAPDILQTVLSALSDWKTCDDAVTSQIKNLLPNNSCTKNDKATNSKNSITTKATRKSKIPRRREGLTHRVNSTYLRYAQQIVNQSLSTLSKVYKEQTDNHSNSDVIRTSVNCLVEVTLYCIQVLEGLEKAKVSCKPLDIEKAYSNIIAKMINFKMHQRAVSQLLYLRRRLLPRCKPPLRSECVQHTLQEIKSIKPDSEEILDFVVSCVEACWYPCEDEMHVMELTKPVEMHDMEVMKLVLACHINCLRCLTGYKNGLGITYLMRIPQLREIIVGWCRKAGRVDASVATTQSDALLRVLTMACNSLKTLPDDNSERILHLRSFSLQIFVTTDRFTLASLLDLALKSVIQFEKTCKNDINVMYKKLLSFHDEIACLIKRYLDELTIECRTYIEWIDHYAYVAQKANDYKKAIDIYTEALLSIPPTLIAQFSTLASSHSILSSSLIAPIIPKLIERFVKVTYLDCPEGNFTPIMELLLNKKSESEKDVVALMEYAVRVIRIVGQFEREICVRRMVESILDIYEKEEYPIRHARVLIEKAKLMRCSPLIEDRDKVINTLNSATELLKTEDFKNDVGLSRLRNHYLATAYSWVAITSQELGQPNADSFKLALALWKIILADVPPRGNEGTVSEEKLKEVRECLDDVEGCYKHLRILYWWEMLADFLESVQQPVNLILTLKLLLRFNNGVRENVDESLSDSVGIFNQLGQTYLQLGYTGKAGLSWSQAKMIMESAYCQTDNRLLWMLGYCRYMSSIGHVDKSRNVFNEARQLAIARLESKDKTNMDKVAKRMRYEQLLLADAAWTRSCILLGRGLLNEAIIDGKRTLRILNRLLSNIDRTGRIRCKDPVESNPFLVSSDSDGKNRVEEEESVLTLAAQRWKLRVTKRLLECYDRLGQLFGLRGSIKEAEFFFNKGLQLAQSNNAHSAMSSFLLNIAELQYRKHCWKESNDLLNEVALMQRQACIIKREEVKINLCLGDLKYRLQDYDQALRSYYAAEDILANIMGKEYIMNIESDDLGDNVLQTPRAKQLLTIPASRTPVVKTSADSTVQFECFLLAYMKANLLRRAGLVMSKKGKIEDASEFLKNAFVFNISMLEKAEHLLILGKIEIMRIVKQLEQPFLTYQMLCDSVLCLPPIMNVGGAKSNHRERKHANTKVTADAIQKVKQADEYLIEAYKLAFACGPTYLAHDASLAIAMLNIIKVYGHIIKRTECTDITEACTYYLEMTKGVAAKREMLAALNEKLSPEYLQDDTQWPGAISDATSITSPQTLMMDSSLLDEDTKSRRDYLTRLQSLYKKELTARPGEFSPTFVDNLPSNWTVCSISIDTDANDMYLCRLRRQTKPFILRLPLKRVSSERGEDDGLSYEEVITEFNDILTKSAQTMGKTCETKEAKYQWWEDRKELDMRMRNLLENIENCWLGGFKGMLIADSCEDPKAVYELKGKLEALMAEALEDILNKKDSNKDSARLDILPELCKVIGRLREESDIEDVIYFLLDLYQYNDIPIAYDEIDVDKLIIDIGDAISKYNNSVLSTDPSYPKNDQHVILILDKNVQMLPWESLPCLRSQAVSRLPSLSFLRDRIVLREHANKHYAKGTSEDYTVDRNKTYYVVNPSKDLSNTQNEFEDYLKSFPEWDGVIGRPPLEQECRNGLANYDLYIYFGHNSGEQYISSHRIRQLDRCAVSLLIGCSSGHLQPAGEFDPSGVALSYMMAGCPALVANLWDVTDKDIDRFSKALFREWGISRDNNERDNGSCISLVQAVSKARKDCLLEYLIGAAPVVYGIPCYLK